MPNLIELLDKSSIIKTKIESIATDINNEIINGNIPNKTAAFIRFRNDVTKFITRLIDVTLQVREAYIGPVSSDINDMIDEIYNDFVHIYNSIDNVNIVLNTAIDQSELEKNMVLNINKNTMRRLQEFNNNLPDIVYNSTSKTYYENFINNENYDIDFTDNPAAIDLSSGLLTLQILDKLSANDSYISILDGSNGLPGDTHIASALNGVIEYNGQIDPHLNLAYINDNNVNTWCEYEVFKIPSNEFDKVNGYGFEYEEGLRWITDENVLILKLNIEFKIQNTLNLLYFNPYIPTERSYIPSYIRSIKLYDGRGNVKELVINEIQFGKEFALNFEPQLVKNIEIEYYQNKTYKTLICHNSFVKTGINNNILQPIELDGVRVDGEKHSIKMLGLNFDAGKNKYIQPTTKNYKIFDTGKLFDIPETTTNNVYSFAELIEANRYQIGIRDINPYLLEFNTYSEYISKVFAFGESITKIELHVNDTIPSVFSEDVSNYIKYYISIDNGKEWVSISPYRNDLEGQEIFATELGVDYIDQVRVKIELRNDESINDFKYFSPIVYNFNIIGRE